MTTALDPKFAKVVALMRSTSHAGERDAARARAEAMAAAAGMTFEEALASIDKPAASANPFAGFDDFMEKEEPGWKARQAAEKAERRRKNLAKRAAVIAKYGTEEAALAPCGRERLILTAVSRWRTTRPAPEGRQRWTDTLDGWRGYGFERKDMPAHVVEAISTVYPLPKTFREAKTEHEHWELRDEELRLILDDTGLGYGDTALDIATGVRADIVRDLVEKDLPVTIIEDLHARFALYRDNESHDERIEAALFRDLSAIVETRHLSAHMSSPIVEGVSAPSTAPRCATNLSTPNDRTGQIRAALDTDPSRSDRDIARACRCSPTTVGRVRLAMGLAGTTRSVRRGGQQFHMKFEGRAPQ